MKLEEARTIWLTLLGSEWQKWVDVLDNPMYFSVIKPAYEKLNETNSIDKDYNRELVKIKCY